MNRIHNYLRTFIIIPFAFTALLFAQADNIRAVRTEVDFSKARRPTTWRSHVKTQRSGLKIYSEPKVSLSCAALS